MRHEETGPGTPRRVSPVACHEQTGQKCEEEIRNLGQDFVGELPDEIGCRRSQNDGESQNRAARPAPENEEAEHERRQCEPGDECLHLQHTADTVETDDRNEKNGEERWVLRLNARRGALDVGISLADVHRLGQNHVDGVVAFDAEVVGQACQIDDRDTNKQRDADHNERR